jgi:type I restriction enzyme, S subunit
MKKGWETKTLDQISTNLDSRRVPITKSAREGGEYPYYGASGIVDYVADYIFDEDALLISEDGANLLTRSSPIAFAASGKYWVNNHAHILKFESSSTQRFIELYLESIPLDDYITGAAQPKLNQKALNSIPIPVPPLAEQQRIVAALDKALASLGTAQANAENNLHNARALFESHLQSVFTHGGKDWMEKTLGEIADIKGGKRVPKGYKLLTEPTGYPYLRVSEFTDSGTIDPSGLRYVSPEVHRQIKNYVIYSSDLYISIAGTIGKTGIVPGELDGANLTENACRLVFRSDVSNRFVYYFTVTPRFVEQAGLNTRTAAQPKLALSRLATVRMGLPPPAEQKRLADQFDALAAETQRLTRLYEQKLAALAALKKSLLHRAFSGEL